MGQGKTIWFTGLSGAGKSTLAVGLSNVLREQGEKPVILDGDELRATVSSDLGFSNADRIEQNRRAANMAKQLNDQGITVIAALISPTNEIQQLVKEIIGDSKCYFIHVDCSIEECIKRDVKSLYKSLEHQLKKEFTGIHQPYEAPATPWLRIDTERQNLSESLAQLTTAYKITFQQ